MTTYTVALPKGGVGKSTTAAELARELGRRGRRVLAIDLDQQGNFTTRLGVGRETEVEYVAADVLRGDAAPEDAAVPSAYAGVDVLAGTHDLIDVEQAPPADLVTSLRDYLPRMGKWDDVVVDTPPSVGGLTEAGLAAADVVVVPVESAVEAYDQIHRLERVIEGRLGRRVRPGLQIDWFVPTMHDSRRLLDREVVEQLEKRYPGKVTAPVSEAVAVKDAYTAKMPVTEYAPTSKVAADYAAVTRTILGGAS